ncbi:IclR family transcriptional regulator [Leucobacter sp. UT-8R-CII-1-4]|uniref:IclR family transcriptional regulator n=1 Tax=Leucobacter sp. UT-8R-CII-1-4 TaxID=3040075 RepID=UPI0024A8A416|nr:IclR family transcriptional regulator [Leucobacter sp. UT-8R-CII-1-4]MDI6023180.1 IclR family transcriptional regulator [Leucobacter sp. UT-8R-CII-1-4]
MSKQMQSTTSPVKSVDRVLDILEALASAGGRLSIVDLAAAAGMPMPTAHRFLRGLVNRGYVRQLPDKHYALGFRMIPLGRAANNFAGLNVESLLRNLVLQLEESVSLAILINDKAEYVARVLSPHAVRHSVEIGERVELYSSSVGKSLLALMPATEVELTMKNMDFRQITPQTIVSPAVLMADVRLCAERGYAIDRQESEIGAVSVAAAARSEFDTYLSISLSGPSTRMTDELIAAAVPLLQDAAEQLCSRQSQSVLEASQHQG